MATAAVLAVAAVTKVRHLAVFREQIADYRFLPYRSTKVAAPTIVAVEGLACAGLLIPASRREAAGLALLLFTVFLAALVAAWIQGRELECGCFGGTNELDSIGAHSVVRTLMFAGLAAVAGLSGGSGRSSAQILLAALLIVAVFLVSEAVRLFTDLRQRSERLAEGLGHRDQTRAEAA